MPKIQWNKSDSGHTTTLTLTCEPDGSVEVKSDDGYQQRFNSPQEAASLIGESLTEGSELARQ